MRIVSALFLILIFSICCSMTQCNKCITGRMTINTDAKRWLPYAGKDSVTFTTATGVVLKAKCFYADTTKQYKNYNCDEYYSADSLGATLEISKNDSLYIRCILVSPEWMCFHGLDRNHYYLGGCNVINGSESEMRRSYASLNLNNFLYQKVILCNAYPGTNPAFDSVYFAKDYGIVSFRYNNLKYFFRH